MKRVGVMVNCRKTHAAEAVRRVAAEAAAVGLELLADSRAAAVAGAVPLCPLADFQKTVEAVLVLGGDGTVLEAARQFQGQDLPLMGLNIGSLGYLTCVGDAQFGEAVRALRHDAFTRDRRATLAGRIARTDRDGEELADALNEVVISRGAAGRLIWLDLELDGEAVMTTACDGLVVSTPTGSTAYALATGGPILLPATPALEIAVICPHSLSFRPLVVPDSATVAIRLARASAAAPVVSVDGQDDIPLAFGERVELRRSPRGVTLLHLPGYTPCSVMSRKLGWGGR
jgi:NAD+ kinase